MSDTSSTTSLLPEAAELYNLLQGGEEEDEKPQTQVWLTPPRNGLAGPTHHHQPPSKKLRSHPLGDVELLTSASVLLAACGVMHALQPILDSAHPARRQRLCATLRSECLHVRTLDVQRFARLCHLLMLPLDVGRSWHARVVGLLQQTAPSPNSSPLSAPRSAPACAASARSTFHSALPPGIEPRGLIGCFGRQTTWCIVAMLRRVLSETNGLVAGALAASTPPNRASLLPGLALWPRSPASLPALAPCPRSLILLSTLSPWPLSKLFPKMWVTCTTPLTDRNARYSPQVTTVITRAAPTCNLHPGQSPSLVDNWLSRPRRLRLLAGEESTPSLD